MYAHINNLFSNHQINVIGNPKRGICPNGCRPELNSDVTEFESPQDTLLREATEFIELYYHERQDEVKGNPECIPKADRLVQVKKCIQKSGTYEHTFDELQHGARMAWRNAPKCANRKYWQQLKLLDCRDVATNKGMFDSCIQHLAKAVSSLCILVPMILLLLVLCSLNLIMQTLLDVDVVWFI